MQGWFLSTIDLANTLEQEKLSGKLGRQTNWLTHTSLDKLGCLPFSQAGRALLFHYRTTAISWKPETTAIA